MPIYWVAAGVSGQATAVSQQAQQDIAAALAFAGWVIAAGIAWWSAQGTTPGLPEGVTLEFCAVPDERDFPYYFE